MNQGYQIIEPSSLERLLGNHTQAALVVAVLEWVIKRLKIRSPQLFDSVNIEVILVSYLGDYPAIGICYKNEDTQDLGPLIEDEIDILVGSLPFSDFISFLEKSNSHWYNIWQELKKNS